MPVCPTCKSRYATGYHVCPDDGATLLPDALLQTAELAAGATVGEYVIEEKLGEGGFGVVFKAVQPLIGKQVAIKVLNRQCSANPEMVSRFISEARAVNQIRHHNIIDIFSFGQLADGRQYYVMELLDGMPLDRHLAARGRLTLSEALVILRPLARALDAAHAKGITHRDLKPENVFLARDGEGLPFPKLLDFGIAKLLQAEAGPVSHKTATGATMGTPQYMSPEQCRGRDVDHRTDTYSFGVIVYQLLTGRLPFSGGSFVEIAFKQATEPPPAPSTVVPGLAPELDPRILWFLEKDPANRPPTIVAGVKALEELAGQVADAPPPAIEAVTAANVAFATAPTMGPGLPAAEVVTVEAPRTSPAKKIALAAVGAAAVVAVALIVALRPEPPPAPEPAVVVVEPPTAPPPPTVAAPPPPTVAAPPATVVLTLQGPPPGTQVVGPGEVVLGTAPGTLRLPRGSTPIHLELRAPGYRPLGHDVTPLADGTLDLALEREPPPVAAKRAPPPKKKPAKDDIEDAFGPP